MGRNTKIAWSDDTWNPIAAYDRVTGKRGWFCVHQGDDCKFCYAEDFNQFRGTGHAYIKQNQKRHDYRLINLALPMGWREPRAIFVNSMTDLFFEGHTFAQIAAIFGIMAACPQHTFLILTKRPLLARTFFERLMRDNDNCVKTCTRYALKAATGLPVVDTVIPVERSAGIEINDAQISRLLDVEAPWPLPNVWLGVSAGGQHEGDERIPALLCCPAALHWLSYEPGIAPLLLRPPWKVSPRTLATEQKLAQAPRLGAERIDWVVIGGESGKDARPFYCQWAREMLECCANAHIPVFVKQMGSKSFSAFGVPMGLKADKGGNMAEWPEDLRVRDYPEIDAPFLALARQRALQQESESVG